MDTGFIAKPLASRQIDQAFPLIQVLAPGLDVDRWRHFARAVIPPESADSPPPTGIMSIQNAQGYIHGLFSYARGHDLCHGPVLAVENVIVLDLFDMAGAASTLVDAVERVATSLGCAAVHTSLNLGDDTPCGRSVPVLGAFRSCGYAVESRRLCKIFATPGKNAAPHTPAGAATAPDTGSGGA